MGLGIVEIEVLRILLKGEEVKSNRLRDEVWERIQRKVRYKKGYFDKVGFYYFINRLIRVGLVEKVVLGHKNVRYKLRDDEETIEKAKFLVASSENASIKSLFETDRFKQTLLYLTRKREADRQEIKNAVNQSTGDVNAAIRQLLDKSLIEVTYTRPEKNSNIKVECYKLSPFGLLGVLSECDVYPLINEVVENYAETFPLIFKKWKHLTTIPLTVNQGRTCTEKLITRLQHAAHAVFHKILSEESTLKVLREIGDEETVSLAEKSRKGFYSDIEDRLNRQFIFGETATILFYYDDWERLLLHKKLETMVLAEYEIIEKIIVPDRDLRRILIEECSRLKRDYTISKKELERLLNRARSLP